MCVGHWQPRLHRRCQVACSGLMIAAGQLTHVSGVAKTLLHAVTGFWRHLQLLVHAAHWQ